MEVAQEDESDAVIIVDGTPLGPELVTAEVDRDVSAVSAVPAVRVELVEQQREIARCGGIVMAGRDIGSVVLPTADLKLYIDAAPEERLDVVTRKSSCPIQSFRTNGYCPIPCGEIGWIWSAPTRPWLQPLMP